MKTRTDTFYRHLREWFTVFLPRQRAVSPHTITACRQVWNLLLGYVHDNRNIQLEMVTFTVLDRALIAGFLDHMTAARGWKAATYNQRLACIRSFFHYAANAEPALAMHLADIAGVPQKKSPNNAPVCHLSTSAVAALLAAPNVATRIGLRDQFFMILMYDLAARDAEMLALTVGDINPQRQSAELVGKGSKPRRLPITVDTAAHFQRYVKAFHPGMGLSEPLFYTVHDHHKTRMSDDNVARFLSQHAEAARQTCQDMPRKVHPHMLRHSRAMHLYQAGMPLAMLTEWLGHADPETTLIYAHADTEMKRAAIEKATQGHSVSPSPLPIWHDRQDIIQRLCGLH